MAPRSIFPTRNLPIVIIGAGVSGLTLAQACRQRSIPFRLFERQPPTHMLQGHRFRISNEGFEALNGILTSELRHVLQRTAPMKTNIEPRYVDVKVLQFGEARPAQNLSTTPVDRAWLRMLLKLEIGEWIEYDKEFSEYEAEDGHVKVSFTDGSFVKGSLLVGADGIKSRVRRQLQPSRRLLDLEKWILWGRTPLTTDLRDRLPEDVLTWFMALDPSANTQVVVDPIVWAESSRLESRGKLPEFEDYIYWALATPQFSSLPRTADERRDFLERISADWHPDLRAVFDSADHQLSSCIPILSSKPDIELASTGKTEWVVIIGDAAHAMSPMGGAGGDLAIRDAVDVAMTVAEGEVNRESMYRFEDSMAKRSKEKLERAFANGQKFWTGKEWVEYKEVEV